MTQHSKRAEQARARDEPDLIDEMETGPTQRGARGAQVAPADHMVEFVLLVS